MAMVIDDRLHVCDEKDRPRVHVVPAYTQYYAPQAEVLFSNEKILELAWGKQELRPEYKLLKKLHARAEAALCLRSMEIDGYPRSCQVNSGKLSELS